MWKCAPSRQPVAVMGVLARTTDWATAGVEDVDGPAGVVAATVFLLLPLLLLLLLVVFFISLDPTTPPTIAPTTTSTPITIAKTSHKVRHDSPIGFCRLGSSEYVRGAGLPR